jgi:hypothetical protein
MLGWLLGLFGSGSDEDENATQESWTPAPPPSQEQADWFILEERRQDDERREQWGDLR